MDDRIALQRPRRRLARAWAPCRVTALLAVLGAAAAAQTDAPLFDAPLFPVQGAVGPGALGVALADIDGDGLLDVLVADYTTLTVHHSLGNGALQAGSSVPYGIPTTAWELAVADVDGDGDADVALAGSGSKAARIVLDAGGDLQLAGLVPIGLSCADLKFADLNGDGRPDLVASLDDPRTLTVSLGLGQAAFTHAKSWNVPAGSHVFDVADLNGDGALDVITACGNLNNKVSILSGLGDGTLGAPATITVANKPLSVAAGDLDGDGLIDFVSSHEIANLVSVRHNDGNGQFSEAQAIGLTYAARAYLVDLDGDDRLDLVATTLDESPAVVSVFKGQPANQFVLQAQHTFPGFGSTAAIGDVTGDGQRDLLMTNFSTPLSGFTLLMARADGSWNSGQHAPAGAADSPADPASGVAYEQLVDVDGDGRPDLASMYGFVSAFGLAVRRGRGDGSFGAPVDTPLPAGFGWLVRHGDLDGDGRADFVCVSLGGSGSDQVVGLMGDGTGALVAGTPVALPKTTSDLLVGDLDGDGDDDLVALGTYPPNLTSVLSRGGALVPLPSVPTAGESRGALGDVDGDGELDLLTSASLWRGLGNGHFAAPLPVNLGVILTNLVLSDLDGDGWLDAVAGGPGSSGASGANVAHALGRGSFAPPVSYPAGSMPVSVAVADMDGGGVPDIVIAFNDTTDIAVLPGHGDATFDSPLLFAAAQTTHSVSVADLDADGWNDLVIGSTGEDVLVRLNRRGPWKDLGFGKLDGPRLGASGPLHPGSVYELHVHGAAPGGKAVILIGTESGPPSIATGGLLPAPRVVVPVILDAAGEARVKLSLPASAPPGLKLVAQAIAPLPGSPKVHTLTNVQQGTVAP